MAEVKWTSDWSDSLIWCPSQLEREFVTPAGNAGVLYCRWRHDDPWTFSVCVNRYDEDSEEHIFEFVLELGSGLSESTPIEAVHAFAEAGLVFVQQDVLDKALTTHTKLSNDSPDIVEALDKSSAEARAYSDIRSYIAGMVSLGIPVDFIKETTDKVLSELAAHKPVPITNLDR